MKKIIFIASVIAIISCKKQENLKDYECIYTKTIWDSTIHPHLRYEFTKADYHMTEAQIRDKIQSEYDTVQTSTGTIKYKLECDGIIKE